MSRHLGWPERFAFHPDNLRRLANVLEAINSDNPQPAGWVVDVVAPQQVWDRYDERDTYSDMLARAAIQQLTPEDEEKLAELLKRRRKGGE